jgi:predicted small metal-binding protein
MKQLSCKDLGDLSCDFSCQGETVEDVMQQAMAHAQEAHADKMAGMSEADMEGLKQQAMAAIKEV